MNFDFSHFHPLDHWALSPECWRWYGGPVNHIKLWWTFQIRLSDDDWEEVGLGELDVRDWEEVKRELGLRDTGPAAEREPHLQAGDRADS